MAFMSPSGWTGAMSQLGHERRFGHASAISGFPLTADVCDLLQHLEQLSGSSQWPGGPARRRPWPMASCKERPHTTTPGRQGARGRAPVRVAFRQRNSLGTRDEPTFSARWLACALPGWAGFSTIRPVVADARPAPLGGCVRTVMHPSCRADWSIMPTRTGAGPRAQSTKQRQRPVLH